MQKQAPTLPRILVMAGFALSCFGLILFLWVAFGGPVPFAAKGYQVKVDFVNAGQLATQADVRISGVPVGKVATVELGPRNATRATLQIDPRYSPIPADSRAILRTKTLLGETYVELTPGNRADGPPLEDDALLPARQVRQQVTIDRIFQLFDKSTRKGFQEWQQGLAVALAGRGGDISDAFGNLPGFTESADRTLEVLNSESDALSRLVRDTGVVFDALSTRGDQLRQSIVNSNTVFTTTAKYNQELADIFTILPTFEAESTKTVNRLTDFAVDANPLMIQLQPAAQQLSPLLESVQDLAPPLKRVMTTLKPLDVASTPGTNSLKLFLNGDASHKSLSDVLGQLDPFLQQLNPMLNYLGLYKESVPAFFGNAAAVTQAKTVASAGYPNGTQYLRISPSFNLMNLAPMPNRPTANRATPYITPGAQPYELKNWSTAHCTGSFAPDPPATGTWALPNSNVTADLMKWIKAIAYAGTNTPLAPGCDQQPATASPTYPAVTWYSPFSDYSGLFPQLEQQSAPLIPIP